MNVDRQTCFVISPFGDPYDAYFVRIIKPAIEECGLLAVRGDSLFRPTTIMDDIWEGIRSAEVLVAELTGRNPNVFYELGLAHAISKPVILLAATIDDVPFDLRSIRVLVYSKDDPDWGSLLKEKLIRALQEIKGNPGGSIPGTFKIPSKGVQIEESETLIRLERVESQILRLLDETVAPIIEAPAETKDDTTLEIDDTVMHARFGTGVVVGFEGKGSRLQADVNFAQVGFKRLMLSYANLQKLAPK